MGYRSTIPLFAVAHNHFSSPALQSYSTQSVAARSHRLPSANGHVRPRVAIGHVRPWIAIGRKRRGVVHNRLRGTLAVAVSLGEQSCRYRDGG